MRKFLLPIVGAIIAFLLSSAIPATEAQAQNCPSDWHPPPCGPVPDPETAVKARKLAVVKEAEKVHWELAAMFGVAVAATCPGSTGDPRIDVPRRVACMGASVTLSVTLAAQQWEKRLIERINGARDGTQAPRRVPRLFAVNIDTGGDQYLDALIGHGYAIEYFGDLIIDAVNNVWACDDWAQVDLRGLQCGDEWRAWTDQLFAWQGEKYVAASKIEAYLATQILDGQTIDDLNDTASFDNDVGWEYLQ